MSNTPVFTPIYADDGQLSDIKAETGGRSFLMLGNAGPQREIAPVAEFLAKNRQKLPVFLGTGLGAGLHKLLEEYDGPIAIVDKEASLQNCIDIQKNLSDADKERILFIADSDPDHVLGLLTQWQTRHGGKAFYPIVSAFYLRLDRPYYEAVRSSLAASSDFDFWSKARAPRFVNKKPRVLLLASKYFLIGELTRACKKLDIPHKLIHIGDDTADAQQFIKTLLEETIAFKPDCAITLNHMGVDREGLLMDLFSKLELPLASWFVDNPHLIIHLYNKCVSPWTTLFTWDEDNVASLRKMGFEHTRYLPLGTDPERFNPKNAPGNPAWAARISFVGNSMLYKVGQRLKSGHFSRPLLLAFNKISAAFAQSEDRNVADLIAREFPEVNSLFLNLADNEDRLAFETAVTWQATRYYRNGCVRKLLPFNPLIVGDSGWKIEFRKEHFQPRYLDAISYYDDLPHFYGMSEINFNCTSKQMKGSVNQRVFDAPAAGAFVLSDWRPQLANLFEPDELACFNDPEEIPELVKFYLEHPAERKKITARARKRVLAKHKWEDRLKTMLKEMQNIYGSPAVA